MIEDKKYFIRTEFGIHEDSTKYYQVISIENIETKAGIVFTHYGAYKSDVRNKALLYIPRLHGTCDMHVVESGVWTTKVFYECIRKKAKRGYRFSKELDACVGENELSNYMIGNFKNEMIEHVINCFDTNIDEDTPPTTLAQNEVIKIEDMPEGWGSW
jgi:hypothetical protein